MALKGIPSIGPRRRKYVGKPSGATNLLVNPDFEVDMTGWGTDGTNTIASSADTARVGTKSCKCTYQSDVRLLTLSTAGYTGLAAGANTFSIDVRIPAAYGGTALGVYFTGFTSATGNVSVGTAVALDMAIRDQWQRVRVAAVLDAGDLVGNVVLRENGSAPTAGHFVYVDAAQLEAGTAATAYVSGTRQPLKVIG